VAVRVLLGSLALLVLTGGGVVGAARRMLADMLASAGQARPDQAGDWIWAGLAPLFGSLAPLGLGLLVLAVLANVVQAWPRIVADRVCPSLGRLWPAEGLRRLVSARAGVRGLLAVGKIACLAAVAWAFVAARLPRIAAAARLGADQMLAESAGLVVGFTLRAAALLALLAAADYLYQRWQLRQDLRMTREEYLEDLRRMAGDPRNRRRREAASALRAARRLAAPGRMDG
jgi:flagellar biosynthesis protein FlhB